MAKLRFLFLILVIYNIVEVTPIASLGLFLCTSGHMKTPQETENRKPANQTCGNAPYRSIDGSCNNLRNPTWGTPFTAFTRMLPNSYADGIHELTRSSSGQDLPSAREISIRVSPDVIVLDLQRSLSAMEWGQTIAHDMSLSNVVQESESGISSCCQGGQLTIGARNTSVCAPISIPPDDPYNAPNGTKCLDMIRGQTSRNRNCLRPNAPYEQINSVTAFMDLSITYGSTEEQARSIRTESGGRLATTIRKGQTWPPQDPNATQTCFVKSSNEPCYVAGDVRVNQNTQLSILQVIFLREHNRVADFLQLINPHWDDERLYQESRRIVIAEMQHINYYEYLPKIIGYENMVKNKLIYPDVPGYVNDYKSNVNPTVLNEHTTVAFRLFHSMIYGNLKFYLENREPLDSFRISSWFNRPKIIEDRDNFVRLVRGLTTQPASYVDRFYDDEISNYLFRGDNILGGDLHSIDIQRARDHGIGYYVDARAICGLPRVRKFSDLEDFIPPNYVKLLRSLYDDVKSVELSVAGLLENHVPGTLSGPTFLCILTEQFYRTRVGDRYYFENGFDPITAINLKQLNTIRKHTLARLYCDNVDGLSLMQPSAFELISDTNELIPCHQIPALDLNLWKDNSKQ